jgi:O-antigen/teichoic acid export membrane protein
MNTGEAQPNTDNAPPVHSLDAAAAGGLAWTAGAKSATQLITWLSAFVTARLLSPSDFGLVNMAAFFTVFTNVVAEFGIGAAVLQMPELEGRVVAQLNTASVAMCAMAYGVTVLGAPLIAAFFKSDQLRLLVVLNGLGLLITGFQVVPIGLLQKDLDFRRLSVAEAVQAVLQATVTVGCALSGFAYWSLVAGALAGRFGAAILTYYWKPAPFALPRWKDIDAPMRLGGHVAVSRLAVAAYQMSDGVIVGRRLGAAALGVYQLAMTLASAPTDKIGMLIMRVTGPLFARVQQDAELVRRYFRLVSESLTLTVFPLMFGLAIIAPQAVAMLGPKWSAAVGPIRWLAVFMGARTLSVLVSQVLTSLRYTRFNMWISLLSSLVMPLAFFVASRWGTAAVAACWVILAPVTILPLIVKLLRVIRMGYWDYLSVLIPALAGSAAMLAAVLAVVVWGGSDNAPAVVKLSVRVGVGGLAYAGFLVLFYREKLNRYVRFLAGLRRGSTAVTATEF